MRKSQFYRWCGVSIVALALCGCGKGATPNTAEKGDAAGSSEAAVQDGNIVPVALNSPGKPPKQLDGMEFEEDTAPPVESPAMAGNGETTQPGDTEFVNDVDENDPTVGVLPGTPEFTLQEILKLKGQPNPKTDDPAQLRAHRKILNEKIINVARTVIEQTHSDKKRERVFDVAVNYMLDARLELAEQGDKEHIADLYDDAASLWERNKNSKPAADAAFKLIELAYFNAKRAAAANKDDLSKENKWLTEFNTQAMEFAKRFPQDNRGLHMLYTAARSCEAFGKSKQAVQAYTQLQQSYPATRQAERAQAVIRRLKLPGQSVRQLGGPTIDGGFLSLGQDLSGSPVVLVFWSMEKKPSLDDLPVLQQFEKSYAKQGVQLVGVCLDEDQAAIEKFLAKNKITWPQIYFNDPGKKGWNNKIANYYGIQDVATWLVDSNGICVSTSVKVQDLDKQLSPLLKPGISRLPSNPPR
ncbi:MAG: alkyl hydroperoxide reductase/Thiol specific antioxidant/Mal allergen [Planctomycetaceae bacterium]|nr:alkyl hydroperoxide reductase/Thiol specific antioxidant/Mal allergen [Planctomycetaceae bacterium]